MTLTTLTPRVTTTHAACENSIWYGGSCMSFLANPQDTNGQYTLIETQTLAGSEPPPHIHTQEDEFFYLLEGQVMFWSGDQEFVGKSGDMVYFPKNVAHGFRILSPVAKALIAITPSGFEEFFHTFGEAAPALRVPETIPAPDIPRFLQVGGELGLSFLPPGMAPAEAPIPANANRPICRSAENAEMLNVLGTEVAVLLNAEDCGGAMSQFEVKVFPKQGVPLHTHRNEDEAIYVIEGEFVMQIGEAVQTVRAGEFAHFPRAVAHSYVNSGAMPGRLLTITTPGGYEAFFREVDGLMRSCAADQNALMTVAQRHGIEILGAPPIIE